MGLLRTGWETKRAQPRTRAIVPVLGTSYSKRRIVRYIVHTCGRGDWRFRDAQSFVSVLYREDSLFTWSKISFQDFSGSMCLARVVEEAVFLRIGLRRDRNIMFKCYKWNGNVFMRFFFLISRICKELIS